MLEGGIGWALPIFCIFFDEFGVSQFHGEALLTLCFFGGHGVGFTCIYGALYGGRTRAEVPQTLNPRLEHFQGAGSRILA